MFEPTHLESFLAVAQTRNFTEAGRRLGLQQSTISQHIRKLEAAAGRRLFVRDTHSVRLTADGEAMTGFAQSILDAANRARRYFAGSRLRGRLRFGVSEDFVTTRLPELLREFVQEHALVDLELNVGSAQSCTNPWTQANSTWFWPSGRQGMIAVNWSGATGWPGSARPAPASISPSRCR